MFKLHKMCLRKGRKIIHLVEIVLPIKLIILDSIVNEFIPPKKTSVMKTVDATVERSLAAAFCRLLVQNVLDYTKRTDQSIEKVKLTDDVMIYDAIELMEKAWDLVPQSVVLNA